LANAIAHIRGGGLEHVLPPVRAGPAAEPMRPDRARFAPHVARPRVRVRCVRGPRPSRRSSAAPRRRRRGRRPTMHERAQAACDVTPDRHGARFRPSGCERPRRRDGTSRPSRSRAAVCRSGSVCSNSRVASWPCPATRSRATRRARGRVRAVINEPGLTLKTPCEICSTRRAMPKPCIASRLSVLRMSKSRVPWMTSVLAVSTPETLHRSHLDCQDVMLKT
jgi:hypothetical protein